MNQPLLLVERIEFEVVKIEASRTIDVETHEAFPQIKSDFNKFELFVRSQLDYPDTEAADPVHFRFVYGIRLGKPTKPTFAAPPYCVEIEAVGYFRYAGKEAHVGAGRFRAVRFTGYQILYGAIREMVANVTARGPNGLWHLPGRNFHGVAEAMSEKDEAARQTRLLQLTSPEQSASASAKDPEAPTKKARIKKAKASPSMTNL